MYYVVSSDEVEAVTRDMRVELTFAGDELYQRGTTARQNVVAAHVEARASPHAPRLPRRRMQRRGACSIACTHPQEPTSSCSNSSHGDDASNHASDDGCLSPERRRVRSRGVGYGMPPLEACVSRLKSMMCLGETNVLPVGEVTFSGYVDAAEDIREEMDALLPDKVSAVDSIVLMC